MNKFKKSLVALAISSIMSGCATIGENKVLNETPQAADEAIQEMNELVNSIDVSQSERKYMEYVLIPERDDYLSIGNRLNKKVSDFRITEAPLQDVLSQLAKDLNVGVVFQIESPMTLKKTITINTNNTRMDDYIKIIENTGNIDIYFVGNNMIVADTMAISGNFSKLEGANGKIYKELEGYLSKVLKRQAQRIYEPANKKDIESDLNAENSTLDAEQTKILKNKQNEAFKQKINRLRTDLVNGNEVQVEFEPMIVIDEITGAFFIKTEPNLLRRSKELIENVINSSLSYALVQLNIYKVNDSKAKSFGISSERVVENLYTLSVGGAAVAATPMLSASALKTGGGDSFSLGISAYEKAGVIRGESNTIVTLFNGMTTELNDTKDVGYWVPGDLTENTNTVNGGVVTSFSETRPTFELSKIGKTLKMTPRIDQKNKVMNVGIEYKDTKVYEYNDFEWQRNTQNGEVVKLSNPMKSENLIKGVVFVRDGNYAILAGTKTKDASIGRTGLPGMNGTILDGVGSINNNSSKTNSLIIVKPIFPNKKSVQLIKKVRNM